MDENRLDTFASNKIKRSTRASLDIFGFRFDGEQVRSERNDDVTIRLLDETSLRNFTRVLCSINRLRIKSNFLIRLYSFIIERMIIRGDAVYIYIYIDIHEIMYFPACSARYVARVACRFARSPSTKELQRDKSTVSGMSIDDSRTRIDTLTLLDTSRYTRPPLINRILPLSESLNFYTYFRETLHASNSQAPAKGIKSAIKV